MSPHHLCLVLFLRARHTFYDEIVSIASFFVGLKRIHFQDLYVARNVTTDFKCDVLCRKSVCVACICFSSEKKEGEIGISGWCGLYQPYIESATTLSLIYTHIYLFDLYGKLIRYILYQAVPRRSLSSLGYSKLRLYYGFEGAQNASLSSEHSLFVHLVFS